MSEPFDLEKYRSIGILGKRTRAANRVDATYEKDAAAYRRLRADGLQPSHIAGSAVLEQTATIPLELEMGRTFSKEEMPHAREGIEISEQIGLRGPYDR
jgi:hypothetical protein